MLGVGDFSTPLAALASVEMTTERSRPSVEMTKKRPAFSPSIRASQATKMTPPHCHFERGTQPAPCHFEHGTQPAPCHFE